MSKPLTSREDWIEAAMENIQEVGLAGLSITLLATRLGVSRMGFYQRFKDKDELIDAVAERWIELGDTEYDLTTAVSGDPLEQMKAVAQWQFEEVYHLDHAMLVAADRDPGLAARHRSYRDQGYAYAYSQLREMGVPTDSARLRAEILLLCGLGLTVAAKARPSDWEERVLLRFVDAVVEFVATAQVPERKRKTARPRVKRDRR